MNKKIFTKHLRPLALLCLIFLGITNAWGATIVTQTYTLADADNGSDVTTGSVKWSIGSNAITASNSNMKLTGTITVKLPTGATLNSVSLTKSNNWGSGATVVFASGTTTLNTFTSSGDFTLTSNKTDLTYTFTKSGTTSKNAWVKTISVTYSLSENQAAAPTLTTEGTFTTTQYDVTITNNEEGATVFYTTDGTDPKGTSSSFTGASKTLSISETTTVKARAYIASKDSSDVVSATYTYKEPVAEATFNKFSGVLVEGDYIITYNNRAIKNVIKSDRLDTLLVEPSNNKIVTSDGNIIWHIAKSGDYWTMYNSSESKYIASTGVKNKAQLLASGSDDKSLWTVTGNSTYDFTNKANTEAKVNATLRFNIGYGFAAYSASTGGALTLYKKAVAGEVSAPTFTPETELFFDGLDVTLSQADNKDIYYTLDGTTPSKSSTKYTTAIHISATTNITAIAYDGENTSSVVSKTYTLGKTYASLAALVAAGAPTTTGETVRVTLTNETITKILNNGIVLKSNEQEVQIFKYDVPESWAVNGTVSGTLTCPWKLYSSTWQLCPTSWDDLEYTAGSKATPTITAEYKTKMSTTDPDDVYTVTTETDGAMNVSSSVPAVASTEYDSNTRQVTINPIGAGTTTIKISFDATDTYYAAEKSYTLTVTEPYSKDDYYAIVSKYDGKYYAMGSTLDNSTLNAVEVYAVNNKVITTSANPDTISWKKNSDNTVQNAAGDYLSFNKTDIQLSTSSSFEYTEGNDDNGSYWYNSTRAFIYKGGTGFKSYAMSNAGTKGYGTLGYNMTFSDGYTRLVTKGNWGTICLPNEINAADMAGAKFYSITGKKKKTDGETPESIILTEETGNLVAGRPYFFKATADTLVVAYSSTSTEVSGDNNGLFGSIYGTSTVNKGYYILSNNKLLKVDTDNFICGANRAYVVFSSINDVPSAKGDVEISVDSSTGIEEISLSAILSQGKDAYNVSGQKVGANYKGIVIVNGKKYINK